MRYRLWVLILVFFAAASFKSHAEPVGSGTQLRPDRRVADKKFLIQRFAGLVIVCLIFGGSQIAVAAAVELRTRGPFWSTVSKELRINGATALDDIEVQAVAEVSEGSTTESLRLRYTILNQSTEIVEIKNPIPALGFTVTNKDTGELVNPRSPASTQDQSRTPKLQRELSRLDMFFLVKGNGARRNSDVWHLNPNSMVELTLVIPNALYSGSETANARSNSRNSTYPLQFPNPELRSIKRKKVPFGKIHGEYSIVTSLSITMSNDTDMSFSVIFDGDIRM